MSRPRTKTTLLDQLRSLISEARIDVDHPNSATAVGQRMLQREFLKKIGSIPGLRMHLFAGGLNAEIRRYLKEEQEDSTTVTLDQLEMWPRAIRGLVQDIDRARVYVPSVSEFLPLVPDGITPAQVREAGEYLISKGEETIRIGKLLITLSGKYK